MNGITHTIQRRIAVAIMLFMSAQAAWATPAAQLAQISGALTIVTPYPRQMTQTFVQAFQHRYPGVKVVIAKKKTTDAMQYLERIAERNSVDLIWASAPATFTVLKGKGLLQRFDAENIDLPGHLGSYPLNDPDGYYTGFAGSGFGMMWNERYMAAKQLPEPKVWQDLAKPVYAGHIGMSAPSRSGTTHVIVEAILQQYGWSEGWQILLAIAGNLQRVTSSSYAVPVGVRDGEFGIGLVIDFYGLSVKARYYPVQFAYPQPATLLPASIGIVNNAPNPAAAQAFIRFLLSPEGQVILLHKDIRRLPVRPQVYRTAPSDYPNPHEDEWLRNTFAFDVQLSTQRYDMLNVLFDALISDNFAALTGAVQGLHRAVALQLERPDQLAAEMLDKAEAMLYSVPVSAAQAQDEDFTRRFASAEDAEHGLVAGWRDQAAENYRRAQQLADEALALLGAADSPAALPHRVP